MKLETEHADGEDRGRATGGRANLQWTCRCRVRGGDCGRISGQAWRRLASAVAEHKRGRARKVLQARSGPSTLAAQSHAKDSPTSNSLNGIEPFIAKTAPKMGRPCLVLPGPPCLGVSLDFWLNGLGEADGPFSPGQERTDHYFFPTDPAPGQQGRGVPLPPSSFCPRSVLLGGESLVSACSQRGSRAAVLGRFH